MELFCEFTEFQSVYNNDISYKCQVTNINRIASNGRVLSVNGTHVDGKSNEDVESITFFNHQIESFPRYLCKFFPNLTSISVIGCRLQTLKKFDFIGCERIEKLMLNGNKIKSLSSDVFDYLEKLEIISLFDNQINYVDVNAFDGLKNLYYANFKMNPTIDYCFRYLGKQIPLLEEIKSVLIMNFGAKAEPPKGNLEMLDVFEFLKNFADSSQIALVDNYNSRIEMMFNRT